MRHRWSTLHPWTRANLLLAGLLVMLFTLGRIPGDREPRLTLTSIGIDQITEIRSVSGTRLRFAARREANGWRVTHPDDRPARAERLAQLLAVARAPVRYTFAAPTELARYGLSPPTAVLHIDGPEISPTALAFGDRDPGQNQRYVLHAGEIRLIDEVFFSLLSLPPSHFTAD